MEGGCLREVGAHGGPTVFINVMKKTVEYLDLKSLGNKALE